MRHASRRPEIVQTTVQAPSIPRPSRWEVVASRLVLDDEWIRLRTDHCRTADGRDVAPYYVLEYADWVNVVALTDEAEIVLVNEYKHGLGRVCLGLPGGVIDPADRDAEAAARRELAEETGFEARQLVMTGLMSVNPAIQDNFGHSYLGLGCTPGTAARANPEPLEPVRMDFAALLSLYLAGDLTVSGFDGASLCRALSFLLRHDDERTRPIRRIVGGLLSEARRGRVRSLPEKRQS